MDRAAEFERDLADLLTRITEASLRAGLGVIAARHRLRKGQWDQALRDLLEADTACVQLRSTAHGVATLIAVRRGAEDFAVPALVPEVIATAAGGHLVAHAAAVRAANGGDSRAALATLAPLTAVSDVEIDGWLPELARLAVAEGDDAAAASVASVARSRTESGATRQLSRSIVEKDPEAMLDAADQLKRAGRLPELGLALHEASVLLAARGELSAARRASGRAATVYVAWTRRRILSGYGGTCSRTGWSEPRVPPAGVPLGGRR